MLASLASLAAAQAPVVQTPCGAFEGAWRNDTLPAAAAFLGVRFADAPPRWRHSAAPPCDAGAYFAATQQAPACIQDSGFVEPSSRRTASS